MNDLNEAEATNPNRRNNPNHLSHGSIAAHQNHTNSNHAFNDNEEEEDEGEEKNIHQNLAIIRSIASYLSLSEVESIGSLSFYSNSHTVDRMISPVPPFHSHDYNSNSDSNTPVRNDHHFHNLKYSKGHGIRVVREEEDDDFDSLEMNEEEDQDQDEVDTADADDADAAAGFGSAASLPKYMIHSNNAKIKKKNNNDGDGDGVINCSDESMVDLNAIHGGDDDDDAPGLIALSPILLLDDDELHDYNEEDTIDSNDYHLYNKDNIPKQTKRWIQKTKRRYEQHSHHGKSKHDQLKEIQHKLQQEIMSHPQSIRSYCLSSHQKAMEMKKQYQQQRQQQQQQQQQRAYYTSYILLETPPTLSSSSSSFTPPLHIRIFQTLTSPILSNIPLSILIDISIQTIHTSNQTILASLKLSTLTISSILQSISQIIQHVCTNVLHTLNPFTILDFFHSVVRVHGSEAIVTGIQSVTTLGSSVRSSGDHQKTKSSLSHHNGIIMEGGSVIGSGSSAVGGGGGGGRLTRDGGLSSVLSSSGLRSNMSDWWRGGVGGRGYNNNNNNDGNGNLICEKMFRKLKKVDSAAKVIKYIERDDEVLTHHAKKRVQKMMHYRVPLRPFVATIEIQQQKQRQLQLKQKEENQNIRSGEKFTSIDFPRSTGTNLRSIGKDDDDLLHDADVNVGFNTELGGASSIISSSYESNATGDDDDDDSGSPFMCTPKSFPPTPSSRAHVMARGTKFAQDVVFLARDQLRVQEGLDSKNEQTRAMAKALFDGKRLAVFNAADVGGRIHLSCGQHSASKVGNDLYCSAKGMIPVLRNSFVYFEMSISTPPLLSMMLHHASLSIGLSTLELPSNALVGVRKGSVGLCSTGQILAGSQWCSPLEPKTYGSGSTVGCLVYLDDGSAFETWDGVMVTASIVFNVDGHVIIPAGVMGQGQNANQTITNGIHHQNQSSLLPIENSEPTAVLPLFVPREEELYPTLTLHSTQTEVLCRFCASDIFATSRRAIGAPDGVTVYAVDGSVLFNAEDGYTIDGDASNENLVDLNDSSMHSLSDVETPRLDTQDSFIYNSVE